jgi:FkbM family methyltransferase
MGLLYRIACSLLHPLGLHLSSWSPARDEYARVLGVVHEQCITAIIDVGANSGQFAQGMLRQGFAGTIHSLEPQSAVHARMQAHARRHPTWRVAERCAVGDQEGELVLNISRNTYSSSLLGNTALNQRAAPATAYVGQETVRVRRLDEWAHAAGVGGRLLLKIDTQGYELKVLQGASGIMGDIHAVLVECALVPLYEGQPLLAAMVAFLETAGFTVVDILPGLRDPNNGRFLGLDLLAQRRRID